MTAIAEQTTTQEASAIEIAARCQLSAAAQELLCAEAGSSEFADLLLNADKLDDAIRFWAAALPVRQAIWWGSLCVWEAQRDLVTPQIENALYAIVKWIEQPSDENRRAAAALIKPLGAATPLGLLLEALLHSGGSIAPPNLPKFEPDARLFTTLLAEAVLLADKKISSDKGEDRRREFIATAAKVYQDQVTWKRQAATANC